MRIAVASSGLEHVFRGVESWAADLGAALHARNRHVVLFKGSGRANLPYEQVLPCWRRDGRETERLLRWTGGRIIWRLGLGTAYGIEQMTFGLRLLNRLRDEHFDVLHVQDPNLASLVQRANEMGIVGTRVILAHGTNEPPEFLEKVCYLQHLTPWALEQARALGVWKPLWAAIPNFVDCSAFAPHQASGMRAELGIPENAFVVLTVAAIKNTHKRVGYVIDEIARLADHPADVHLVAAGSIDPESESLIARGRQLLGDRFHVLVNFPRSKIPDLYGCADLFVLASLREMMPMAVLEALSSGLPCLVHRHPVLEWMAGPGGQVLDMSAPGQLSEAITSFAEDPQRRQTIGQAARAHCLASFSRERILDQIEEYYRRVTSPQRNECRSLPVGSQVA